MPALEFLFFFFKQKTAYEIGLGIPAEPLFRSIFFRNCSKYRQQLYQYHEKYQPHQKQHQRSEERRVGKECRSRGWADHQKKNDVMDKRGRNLDDFDEHHVVKFFVTSTSLASGE